MNLRSAARPFFYTSLILADRAERRSTSIRAAICTSARRTARTTPSPAPANASRSPAAAKWNWPLPTATAAERPSQSGTLLIDPGATPGTGSLTFNPNMSGYAATVIVDNSYTSGSLNQTSTTGSATLNIGYNVPATLTINQTTSGTFAGTLTLSSGSGLVVNASGTSLTISSTYAWGGNNTLTVNSGTLAFTNSTAGSDSGAMTVTVAPAATLQLAGTGNASPAPANITNHGSIASGGKLYVSGHEPNGGRDHRQPAPSPMAQPPTTATRWSATARMPPI